MVIFHEDRIELTLDYDVRQLGLETGDVAAVDDKHQVFSILRIDR